jgi:hypothetical protein
MRRLMTIAVLACGAAILGLCPQAQAAGHEPYPWCAYYGEGRHGGGTNCGFDTFAQCRATISGVGGYCGQNPMYGYAERPRRNRR